MNRSSNFAVWFGWLVVLLIWSAASASAQTTYTVTAHTFQMTNGTGGTARITSGKFYANGSGGYGGVSGSYSPGATVTWSTAAGSFTDTQPFVVRYAWNRVGTLGPSYYWVSSVPAGGPAQSTGGPMNSTGTTYQNAQGNSTDPFAPVTPPASYRKTVTISTPNQTQWWKLEIVRKSNGQTVTSHNVMVPPNTTKTITLVYNFDFVVKRYLMTGVTTGNGSGYEYIATGTPVVVEDAEPSTTPMPTNANGEQVFTPLGPSSGDSGGIFGTGDSGGTSTLPGAVPNETRPGTQDGNDDARNKELRAEVARVGTIVNQGSADIVGQLRSNQQSASEDANKLKEAIEDVGQKMEGDGLTAGDGATDTGMANLPGNISSGVDGLKGALGNLRTAILGNVGVASLEWNVTILGSPRTVTLAPYATYITLLRTGLLWFAGICFVIAAFKIIRGALVDES